MKFRKKPVVIDAFPFPFTADATPEFIAAVNPASGENGSAPFINTLEGPMNVIDGETSLGAVRSRIDASLK